MGELGVSAGGGEGLGPTPTPSQVNITQSNDTNNDNSKEGANTIGTSVIMTNTITTSQPQTTVDAKPALHMQTTLTTTVTDQSLNSNHFYHRSNSGNQNVQGFINDFTDDFSPDSKKRKTFCP